MILVLCHVHERELNFYTETSRKMTAPSVRDANLQCYHCGTTANQSRIELDGKLFCCTGCKAVYQILVQSELCRYYDFERSPGLTPSLRPAPRFEFLDDPVVLQQLLDYSEGSTCVLTLHVPQMHCSSCIWLLEHLYRLDGGIEFSRVDFLKKTLFLRFTNAKTSLRRIVALLASLGYEPELSLGNTTKVKSPSTHRMLYLKLGVAAFCFGNIMLFSLPEYLAGSKADFSSRSLFEYLNLLLALPVAFYSSSLFYVSAFQGLRRRAINIDVPIALGIAVVFLRSAVEVIAGIGPGYFDSLTGLVFFLLIGRVFQNKTYEGLNFDRKYQSYFPLAAAVRKNGTETTIPITSLRPGDRIVVRNNEIIPADAVIMNGSANIDYSFVTGESHPSLKEVGEIVYAGGKQIGSTVELEAVKEVSESKLMQLWNEFGSSEKSKSRLLTLSTTIGKQFTLGILILAALTGLIWLFLDSTRVLNAVTAILIVACPCALALAAPFAFGTTMRLYGTRGFFLKNTAVVEALAKIDTVIFDKTGTITQIKSTSIQFVGDLTSDDDRRVISTLSRSSTHPLSRAIVEYLSVPQTGDIQEFEECEGEGISGLVEARRVVIGSAKFVHALPSTTETGTEQTRVYASVDGRVVGWFAFKNKYREGLHHVLTELGSRRSIVVLSGDSSTEERNLKELYPAFAELRFNQTPAEKLRFVRDLQAAGHKVLMVGDGLNDAGALWQSDVAIAVTEEINAFSPACDVIFNASQFGLLGRFVGFASTSLKVVYGSIALSLIYNIVGLSFAVQGALSPILAAILMPLSSISVVVFSTTATRILARRKGLI
jgi:P-type Cu+ transporter